MTTVTEGEAMAKDATNIQAVEDQDEDIVNPWEVKAGSLAGVDYDKLIGELELDTLQHMHMCLS